MSDYKKLADMIRSHNRIAFFGGAGVSTESDIPDFRGANGLYNQRSNWPWSPEEMLSHHFFEEHMNEFFENYVNFSLPVSRAKPNRAHYVLAELEKMGKLSGVITQNIDGLHQKAKSKNVMELHGSIASNTCMKCGHCFFFEEFLPLCKPVPHCPFCGGVVKPDVVLYEESLDMNVIMDAVDTIQNADMLIIGGTSLVVYPAAGFIDYFAGDKLVIINQDETVRDSQSDLVFHESAGTVFTETLNILKEHL